MENILTFLIVVVGLVIALMAEARIVSDSRRLWTVTLTVSIVVGLMFFVHHKKLGKPLPSFALSNGQTYEVLRHFEENGISIAYLAPATIRFSDYSYSRNGEPRFYAIDGAVPTNRIVVAFTESKWGYLRPVDPGTNEFHLSQ